MNWPWYVDTPGALITALHAVTDDDALARYLRDYCKNGDYRPLDHIPVPDWPIQNDPTVIRGETQIVPLGKVKYVCRAGLGERMALERVQYEIERVIRQMKDPEGMLTQLWGRIYPFGIKVETLIWRHFRRAEIGWSSDGTYTKPLYEWAGQPIRSN